MSSNTNEVESCNIIILPHGDICSRKKTNDSDFCSFHLKREQKAGPRISRLCNHIYKETRCGKPATEENGLCSKHGTFRIAIMLAEGDCRCRGTHHCGVRN